MQRVRPPRRVTARLALALAALVGLGCATIEPSGQSAYSFFGEPRPSQDPWYQIVEEWQARELRDDPEAKLAMTTGGRYSGLLRIKMGNWEAGERMSLAKRIAAWAQSESRRHYVLDPFTAQADDPWPTTKDLLETNKDDCDGLDLISYKLMVEFGFPRDQLYRAIVRRERDGANHMVTLWFDNPDDPWLVDSTGAVSVRVRRFSQLIGWTPTKVFNQSEQYTPARLKRLDALAHR